MDLRNTQLKDTYGNLVTTGTTAGSPTTGGLQNGQGTLLTSVGIGTDSPNALLELSGRSDTGDITMRFADKDGGVLTGQDHSNIEYFATDGSAVSAEVKTIYADVVGGLDYTISTRAGGGSLAERLRIRSTGDISFRDGSASEAFYWDASWDWYEFAWSRTWDWYDFAIRVTQHRLQYIYRLRLRITQAVTWVLVQMRLWLH
jgi:hypothetical protein